MATTTSRNTGLVAIELAGAAPVFLDSVALPSRSFPPAGAPSLGGFEARFKVSEAGKLLDWVMSLARREGVESAGAVVVADQNFDRQRRFDWTAGVLTGLELSTLDASASKQVFAVTARWQPAKLASAKDSGKLQAMPTKKAKAWTCANFRVKLGGLPGVESQIIKVELPTMTAKPTPRTGTRRVASAAQVEFGPLRLTITSAGVDAAREWVQAIVERGGVRPSDMQTVSIDMLDAALSKTLGTITVDGCSLLGWEESALEASSTSLRTAVLSFAVQGLALKALA